MVKEFWFSKEKNYSNLLDAIYWMCNAQQKITDKEQYKKFLWSVGFKEFGLKRNHLNRSQWSILIHIVEFYDLSIIKKEITIITLRYKKMSQKGNK